MANGELETGTGGRQPDRRRFLLVYVLPVVVLLLAAVLPLASGSRSLFLRDVFGTHLEMKWFQAEAMRAGELPLIDPYRAGGQAHLGNPNTVPLYPDNLLYLVASPFWALNAHFWLHLLLAPFSFFWLARVWGLGREASWMGGCAFAASGFFLSNLNLYNLVAGVALTPALVAAALALARGERRGLWLAATALLWTLLIFAGDPMTAALALLLALGAVLLSREAGRRGWAGLAGALVAGTLMALPQLVEFWRILPDTFRGYWGYSAQGATVASWSPAALLEWLIPLFFGRPDLGFWGSHFSGGELPLYFSLAPGVLVLGLVLASGRPAGRAHWWAWGAVALGLFVALGRNNPLLGLALKIPGLDLVRLPVKLWLLVAVGASLLAALGAERLMRDGPRLYGRVLGALFVLYAGLWLFLSFGPAQRYARWLITPPFGDGFVEQERVRWAGVCLITLLVLVAAGATLRLSRRWPLLLALLPLLHLASQLVFLRPLLASEPVEIYRAPPTLLELVGEDERLAHGDHGSLFGEAPLPVERYPDRRLIWLERQGHEELYPFSGSRWHRAYELNLSPEGLDVFLTRATKQAVEIAPDEARVRLLAASGVDLLLLGRPLDETATELVELVESRPTRFGEIHVYRLLGRAEDARFVSRVARAPHLNAALGLLTDPRFDARTSAVLPGQGPATDGPPGRVRWLTREAELMELEVEAPAPGVLVVQRSLLPILEAEVDGISAPLVAADMHRIGIELEPGHHRVRIWADRSPLRLASAVSLLALAGLLLVSRRC